MDNSSEFIRLFIRLFRRILQFAYHKPLRVLLNITTLWSQDESLYYVTGQDDPHDIVWKKNIILIAECWRNDKSYLRNNE